MNLGKKKPSNIPPRFLYKNPTPSHDSISHQFIIYLSVSYVQATLPQRRMLQKKDDNYKVTVTEKEVVPNSSYNEGYYIADTNLVTDLTLGLDARIASLEDGKLVVESADEFIKSKAEHKDQLFTVYMMGTSAELIIGTDPADVMID